jgi:hypothetical protein
MVSGGADLRYLFPPTSQKNQIDFIKTKTAVKEEV